jgi:hypothetical protein
MKSPKIIKTVMAFIEATNNDSSSWPLDQPRWFRGEPNSGSPLLPSVYRNKRTFAAENRLLQTFRARAPGFYENTPDRGNTDQWLFLAQHTSLPTRLLDWSEGALLGLYFALKQTDPVVWMLNPLQLNYLAEGSPEGKDPGDFLQFPLPWFSPEPPRRNVANENIRGAWEQDQPGVDLPMAIHPTFVHGRLRAQKSCFTVQGKDKRGLQEQLGNDSILKKYEIASSSVNSMRAELHTLGITESVMFPDLDGLARELADTIK